MKHPVLDLLWDLLEDFLAAACVEDAGVEVDVVAPAMVVMGLEEGRAAVTEDMGGGAKGQKY